MLKSKQLRLLHGTMEDDLELRALRLKKMMKLMASKPRPAEEKRELTFEEALKVLRPRLVDRGDEVLEAALEQYPEQAKRIVILLAEKITEDGFEGKITGEALLSFFEYLGMPVKLRTKILYYKKGEYKSITDLLK